MSNIVLTRIDDRLIHGQVMTAWVKHTNATRIVIIDNFVAKDEFMKKVLTMAAPPGIVVEVFDLNQAIKNLSNLDDKVKEKIIILVKTPEILEQLIDGGIAIDEIVVGGMGAKPGRKRLYKNISISEDEKETFIRLIKKGVKVIIRIVPDERPVPIKKVFK